MVSVQVTTCKRSLRDIVFHSNLWELTIECMNSKYEWVLFVFDCVKGKFTSSWGWLGCSDGYDIFKILQLPLGGATKQEDCS